MTLQFLEENDLKRSPLCLSTGIPAYEHYLGLVSFPVLLAKCLENLTGLEMPFVTPNCINKVSEE